MRSLKLITLVINQGIRHPSHLNSLRSRRPIIWLKEDVSDVGEKVIFH
jgi:hypothetical protein